MTFFKTILWHQSETFKGSVYVKVIESSRISMDGFVVHVYVHLTDKM